MAFCPAFMLMVTIIGRRGGDHVRISRTVGDTFWVSPSVLQEDRMTCPCVTVQARVGGGTHKEIKVRGALWVSPGSPLGHIRKGEM